MIWFLPLIGSFLGGSLTGAAIKAGIRYLLDKYQNAKYAKVVLKRRINGTLGAGSYRRDDYSLGLNIEDEDKKIIGYEDSFDEETRDFFSDLENGDIIDLETGEVYRNVG